MTPGQGEAGLSVGPAAFLPPPCTEGPPGSRARTRRPVETATLHCSDVGKTGTRAWLLRNRRPPRLAVTLKRPRCQVRQAPSGHGPGQAGGLLSVKGPGQRHCADTTPTTAPPRRCTSGPPAASTGSHPQAPRRAAHAPPRPFREGRRFSSRSAATGVDSRRASCVRWPLAPDTPPLTGGVWAPLEVPWRPEGGKPASTCEPPRDGVLGCPEVSLGTANTDLMSRPLPKRG